MRVFGHEYACTYIGLACAVQLHAYAYLEYACICRKYAYTYTP